MYTKSVCMSGYVPDTFHIRNSEDKIVGTIYKEKDADKIVNSLNEYEDLTRFCSVYLLDWQREKLKECINNKTSLKLPNISMHEMMENSG